VWFLCVAPLNDIDTVQDLHVRTRDVVQKGAVVGTPPFSFMLTVGTDTSRYVRLEQIEVNWDKICPPT